VRTALAGGLVLGLALGAAGCSGGSSHDHPRPAATAASIGSTVEDAIPLRVSDRPLALRSGRWYRTAGRSDLDVRFPTDRPWLATERTDGSFRLVDPARRSSTVLVGFAVRPRAARLVALLRHQPGLLATSVGPTTVGRQPATRVLARATRDLRYRPALRQLGGERVEAGSAHELLVWTVGDRTWVADVAAEAALFAEFRPAADQVLQAFVFTPDRTRR
jgi:hypothetical protein